MPEKEPNFIPESKSSKKEIIIDGKLYVKLEFMPGVGIGGGIYKLPEHQELIKKCNEDDWTSEEYEQEREQLERDLLGAKEFLRTVEFVEDTKRTKSGEWPIISNQFLDIYETDTKNEFVVVYKAFETKSGVKGSFNESHTWVLRVKKDELLNHFLPEELHKNEEVFKKGGNIKYIDPESSYLEYF